MSEPGGLSPYRDPQLIDLQHEVAQPSPAWVPILSLPVHCSFEVTPKNIEQCRIVLPSPYRIRVSPRVQFLYRVLLSHWWSVLSCVSHVIVVIGNWNKPGPGINLLSKPLQGTRSIHFSHGVHGWGDEKENMLRRWKAISSASIITGIKIKVGLSPLALLVERNLHATLNLLYEGPWIRDSSAS